jgi:hypothetical protein
LDASSGSDNSSSVTVPKRGRLLSGLNNSYLIHPTKFIHTSFKKRFLLFPYFSEIAPIKEL